MARRAGIMSGKEAKSLSLTTFLRVGRQRERDVEREREREAGNMVTFFIWCAHFVAVVAALSSLVDYFLHFAFSPLLPLPFFLFFLWLCSLRNVTNFSWHGSAACVC